MTLATWEARYGLTSTQHNPSSRSLAYDYRIWGGMAWGLWHLTDWRVTGVTGGSIWLYPREQPVI